jgi:hypothetical protein
MKTSTIEKTYKIYETGNSFIFTNAINISIELNKFTGEFVTGNVYDNEQTRKLFSVLFNIAKSKQK